MAGKLQLSNRPRPGVSGLPKRLLFAAVAALLSIALSSAAAEVLLRMTGRTPWRPLKLNTNEPTMADPDEELGWRPKAGSYVIPPYSPGAAAIQMTLLPDGTRWTGADGNGREKLAFVGCSFTQGWGISDEETFAWRIQQRFPTFRVLNYGTGAYSTYQSLLVLEKVLAGPDPPKFVFYGFIEEHEARNVADPAWLRILNLFSKGGMVSVPYCTLNADGSLQRHDPEAHPRWPLREYSALVNFLQASYLDLRAGNRAEHGRPVTEQLLLEMQRLAQHHGAHFCVVLLHFSPVGKTHYSAFLEQHGVDFVDCSYPITAEMQVPGNNMHPNGKMNARYADCIAAKIQPIAPTYR